MARRLNSLSGAPSLGGSRGGSGSSKSGLSSLSGGLTDLGGRRSRGFTPASNDGATMDSLLDGILDQDEAPAHSSVGRSNNRKSKRAGKKGNRSSVHANDDGEEETSAKNFRPMNKRSIPLPKGVKKGGSSGGSGDIFDSMFGGNAGGGSKARGKKKLGRGKSTSNLGLSGNSASASLTSPRSRSKTGGGLKEKKEEKKESGNKADFSSMYSKSSSDNRLGHADSHRKEEEEAGTGGIFLPGGGDSSSTDVEDEEVNNQHPQTSGRKANDDEGENWDEDGDDWDTETGENSPSLGSKSKSKLATRSIRASPTPSPSLSMSALNNRGSTGNGRRGRRGESIGSINTNSVAVDNVTANADSKPSPQGGAAGQEVVATLSKKERYRLMKEKRRQRNASANSNTSDSITTNSKTNNNSNGIEASSPSNQGSTAMNTNLNLNNNTNTIAATATPSHANKNIPPPSPSPSAFGEQDDEWGDADPLDMLGDNSNQMGHDYNPLTSNISKQSSAPLSMQIPSKQGASATGEDDISNGDDFSGGYTPSSVTSGRRGRGLGRKTMVGMGNNNGISNSISHNSASFGQVSPNSVSKPVSQSIRLKVSGKDNENAPIMSNRVRASSASARVDTAGSHSSNSLSKPLANVNEEPLAQQKMHHDLGSNTRIIANKNTNNNSINTASSDAITLDHWCVWLGLNPTSVIDKPLIRIAEKALSKAKLPKHYSFRNNTFTNAKTKTSSSAHPALKKYQEKLSQLRLAIQYGYDDLSDSETEETGTESMADIPNHSNTSIQSPASPHAHKAASPAASSSSSPSASSSSSPQHGIAQTMASRQERLSYLDASAAARATADSFGRGDNVRSATTAGTAATPSSILLQQQNSLPKAHSMSQSPFAAAANIGAGVDATNPIHQAELVALAKANDQTIQSLEKNREDLTHQLYTSNRHLQEMLSEQRLRLHAQHQDELNAVRRKVEQKETELRNEEARHQDTKRYYEQRIQEIELNRGQWIAENVKEATERAEERIQHTQKLYHKTLEHEKQKFKRETQSLQEQHRRDLSTVKAQQDNGAFLQTLMNKLEMQHRSLEILREKVSKDRSTSEKVAMEQLDIRNELLGEMESKVKLETQRNQEVFETFKRLKGEHEEEKIRLTQEHKRLQQLQDDLTAESTVLRDSIVTERERLKKDRGKFDQDQSAWAIRQKREAAELEMRASMCARASKQAQHDVEETNKQRIDIMRQLDIERQQLRVEKKSVNMRKKRMDGEEGALRVEQARIKEQVRFIEEKMQELAVLGEKVKQQSHICAAATAEIEDAKKEVMMMQHETLSLKQEAEVMHAEANQETKRLQQERVQFEKERLAVLKESQVTKEHNESLIDEKNNLFIERERLQKKYKALTEREKRRGRSRSVDGDANKDIEHNQHNKDSSVTFSEPPHVNIKVSDSKDVYNTSNFDQSFSKAFTAGHDTSLSVNSNPNHPYFNNTSNINIGNNNNNNSNSNTSLDYLEAEGRFLEEQLSKIHRDREWIESLTYA